MHRSHTSVFTEWLRRCGLFVGDSFADTSIENPSGYWEDLDFVSLHDDILNSNRMDPISAQCSLSITDEQFHRAKQLFSTRMTNHAQWGWKDPRTCILYQSLWSRIIDEHYLIAVTRPYRRVIDSLLLRSINDNRPSSTLKALIGKYDILSRSLQTHTVQELAQTTTLPNVFLKSWITHNRAILNITSGMDQKCTLFIEPGDTFNDRAVIDFIAEKWGIALEHVPFNDVWTSRRKLRQIVYNFDTNLLQEAEVITKELALAKRDSANRMA